MEYYKGTIDDIISFYNTNKDKGLSNDEASKRLAKYGLNKLQKVNKRNVLFIFFDQLKNVLAIMLLSASVFALYLGEFRDAIILTLIVLVNAMIGVYQEYKAEKIIESLENLVVEKTKVLRDGKIIEINSENLVVGDIVYLEEGDGVPADIRLIYSDNLATNDSSLTGESIPKDKFFNILINKDVSITQRINCVFMGMIVVRGSAYGVVFATGMNTEIGKIAKNTQLIDTSESPLQIVINNMAKVLTKIALVIAFFMFLIKYLFDESLKESLIFAIGVAAAMVPEGLPAQISTALFLGINRLASKNAIIKKMLAIETLGCTTVIASDKTGTITKNEMTISHCYFDGKHFIISGSGYAPVGDVYDLHGVKYNKDNMPDSLKIFFLDGYLASTGKVCPPDKEHKTWYSIGDPTESSFATLILKLGFDINDIDNNYPIQKIFHFDSHRKRMSIVRKHKGKQIVFVKGSIESILQISNFIIENDEIRKISDEDKKRIFNIANTYASKAFRVICMAYKDLDLNTDSFTIDDVESNLIFSGFVAMMDPPHDEVKKAINDAIEAHIKVVMITGDNLLTAKAIAENIGMIRYNVFDTCIIDASTLNNFTDSQLADKMNAQSIIFSRVSPDDKMRIVNILKSKGEIVAVTGDGVNDALSLKSAHIGISMGLKGSTVAKESSDMILLDDNFSTIVVAIKEGRTIYKNLEKTILSSITSNFGELFCVLIGFIGVFFGLPMSIQAVQILAIDLCAEMLPLAFLTFDPPPNNIMKEKPRDKNKKIITYKVLFNLMFFGFIMGLVGFLSFLIVWNMTHNLAQAQTVAYLGIVFSQFVNILSRRTEKSIFTKYIWSNKNLIISFVLSIIFVLCIVYVPIINIYLHTAPLNLTQWLIPLFGALIFLLIWELKKFFNFNYI